MELREKRPLFWIIYTVVIIAILTVCVIWMKPKPTKPSEEEPLSQAIEPNEKILEVQREYIPGIVCWGDSHTERGWVEPFEQLVKDNVTTLLQKENGRANIPIVNMGVGSETSKQIVARSGAAPYLVAKDFTIPSDTSLVNIEISFSDGTPAGQVKFGRNGMQAVKISDIAGEIKPIYEGDNIVGYQFRRAQSGTEIEVKSGTTILTNGAVQFINCLPIIFMGTNGGYNDSPQELAAQIQSMLDYSNAPEGRYIVLGIYTGNKKNLDALEIVMKETFGDHYISLREILTDDYLQEDKLHFTSEGYQIIAQKTYERMSQLGYFNEVLAEIK